MSRRMHAFFVSMRIPQWVKNLFVLAPLLFGRRLGDPQAIINALCATAAFCLTSSAMYIFNDVLDAAADREHPAKRLRPVAAGALPSGLALAGAAFLSAASLAVGLVVGMSFVALVLMYLGLTLAYSVGLKRIMLVDAMLVAAGFVLRVLGGSDAVAVQASHWLIVCAFLLALYLAFAKRRQELLSLAGSAGNHRRVLGEYSADYLEQVNNILIGAAIVCYALYTVAPETVARFGTDRLLFGTVFVIYGLFRYKALVQTTSDADDPSRLLLKDKPLLLCVLGWALYNGWLIYS